MIQKTVRTYVVTQMLIRFASTCIAATYTIYLMERGGLDLFQISLVNLVFFTTMFFSEIPTGAFADSKGRKLSFVIACSLSTVAGIVYALSSSFWGFALAEALAALGCTFCSGAFQAWFKDNLEHHGYTGDIAVIFARENQLCNVVGALASVAGAHASTIHISLPWIMSALFMALAGIAGLIFIKEDYLDGKVTERQSMLLQLAESWYIVKLGGPVALLMGLGIVFTLGLAAPNMQWQPHFSPHLGNKTYLGYFWVCVSAAIIVGSEIGARLRRGPRFERGSLIVAQASVGLFVALSAAYFPGMILISFYMLHEVGRGVLTPLRSAYINDSIPDNRKRATLLSCCAVTGHLGGMIGLFISGLLARELGIGPTWIASGLFILLGTIAVASHRKTA